MQVLPGKTEVDTAVVAVPVSSDQARRTKPGKTHSFSKPRRSHPMPALNVNAAVTSSTRVYKAPQALVRNGDNYVNAIHNHNHHHHRSHKSQTSTSVGGTRRRRRLGAFSGSGHHHSSSSGPVGTHDHESDTSVGEELPAPPLWGDELEDFPKISPYSRKKDAVSGGGMIPEISWDRTPPSRSSSIRHGCDEYSENTVGEEELFAAASTHLHTHLHTHDHSGRCCPPHGSGASKSKRSGGNSIGSWWWCTSHPYANAIQCCVLLVLAFLVFDSHHRVHKHRIQLQEYDEERAHILEQMMWIDQAAKKVHKRYAANAPPQDAAAGTVVQAGAGGAGGATGAADAVSSQLQQGSEDSARAALQKLQVRIQLNARDRLGQRFGDKPAEISLKLNNQGEHLIVALSDDTPHTVSILLEQVERRVWDSIRVEKAASVGAVQIASTRAATTPLLEFIEPSRGCHEAGSVAIRQEEEDELHVLKLRVNLIANSPMEKGEVCIGRAVSSLVTLQEMARKL